MKALGLVALFLLSGCGGGQDELNDVELSRAAAELSNDADRAVDRQINEIKAEERAADQSAKPENGNKTQ